jgi:hypothetical protein
MAQYLSLSSHYFAPTLVCVLIATTARAVPVVWTGSSLAYSKLGSADPNLPGNQDRLTDNVWLTRGEQEGMFNIAPGHETGYVRFTSPADTKWATDVMTANAGKTITAANYQNLAWADWAAAYGGPGFGLLGNITTHVAVVHLLTDDIYLNVLFTGFNNSGDFAYIRSTPSDGDYNGDQGVDIADYVQWRKTLNQAAETFDSADGNANGTIDANDYAFWRERFGNHPSGFAAAGGLEGAGVPEPASVMLFVCGLVFLNRRRRR